MAKAYSNDLRCKLLTAYDRGQGSLRALAEMFSVSYDWAKKISRQRLRSQQMERVAQSRHGVVSRVTPAGSDPNETANIMLWGPPEFDDDDDDDQAPSTTAPQASAPTGAGLQAQDKAMPTSSVARPMTINIPAAQNGMLPDDRATAQIQILKAVITDTSNIRNGIVTANLVGPGGTSGDLTLTFSGKNGNYTQVFPKQTIGFHTLKLDLASVLPDKYDSIDQGGTWNANVPGSSSVQSVSVPSGSFAKDWIYLGQIRFSQYNTSVESKCKEIAPNTQPFYILTKSDRSCDYVPGQLDSLFVTRTLTNGTGMSINYGLLKPFGTTDASVLCDAKDLPAGVSSMNTFVKVSEVTGSCNIKIAANQSVATFPQPYKNPGATLQCSDALVLDQSDNTTYAKRVVSDLCPGCYKDFDNTRGHIDSYTDNQSCDSRPGGDDTVTDLGKYYTATTR